MGENKQSQSQYSDVDHVDQVDQVEIFNIIDKLANRYKSVYTFGDYTEDDIYQECFIFGMEGLKKYIPEQTCGKKNSLENFLSVHIRYQLLNLKRNKLHRTVKETNKFDKARKLIARPINIDEVDNEQESNMYEICKMFETMSYQELRDIIDVELEVEYRLGFLKLLDGKVLSKFHRDRIITRVKEIIMLYHSHGEKSSET